MNTRKSLGTVIFGLAATAAAGYILGLLTPEEKKREYGDKLKQLKTKMEPENMQKRVKDIYESINSEALSRYDEVRSAFMDRLAALRGSLDDINKQKYEDTLEEFMADLKKQGDLSKDQLTKLKRYFSEDYRLIKQNTGYSR